jgi:transposase
MAIKPKHVLLAVGLAFVVIGHLGDGTSTREVAFWLGVGLSFVGLGWQLRDESAR